jgi:hypothetical protein
MVLVGKSEGKIPCAENMFLHQNYAEIKIFLHFAFITKLCKIYYRSINCTIRAIALRL